MHEPDGVRRGARRLADGPLRPGRWRLTVFLLSRALWAVPVLLSTIVVTFALMHLAPGSPWDQEHAGSGPGAQLSETALRRLDAKYGLDEPWWRQLGTYLGNVIRLDLGDSYHFQGREVRDLLGQRLEPTAVLVGGAFLVVVAVGVTFGVLAGLRRNSAVDYLLTGVATLGASIPNFVVGITLILVFSVGLNRLTGGDYYLPSAGYGLDARLVMPIITLSLLPLSFVARLVRSQTIEALQLDHVRTAHAKGLPPRRVVTQHVLRNSLVPVVTTLGPMTMFLVSGTIVVESVFQIPGLGGGFVQAVSQRDYPVILGVTIVYTVVVTAANTLVDMAYTFIDPRMQPSA